MKWWRCSKIITQGLLLIGLLNTSTVALAAVMPVIDFTEIAKTTEVINQLNQQYQTLKAQYDTLKNQYAQMKTQYASITGNYGWGSYKNSLSTLTHDREWAASDWQSALKGMSGGNAARYQQLQDQYKENHKTLSQTDYAKGADKSLSASYTNQVQTNQASATTSTYEFNAINDHLKTLYDLGNQIEDATKNQDMKAAIDLNSRIELEVAYVALEELRMATLLNLQLAQQQASNIAEENETSLYNQAGEQT